MATNCYNCGKLDPKHGNYCDAQCQEQGERKSRQIAQNVEDFYNPEGARRRRQQQQRAANALSEIFVGGLPYTDNE